MCSIVGVIVRNGANFKKVRSELQLILYRAKDRGRDSMGIGYITDHNGNYLEERTTNIHEFPINIPKKFITLIANNRGEPTTEYIQNKTIEDVHPFTYKTISIVHNGVVANDTEMRNKYNIPIVSRIDSSVIPAVFYHGGSIEELKGSFALLTIDHRTPNKLYAYRDYKPLVMRKTKDAIYFASKKEYFSSKEGILDIPPYSSVVVDNEGNIQITPLIRPTNNKAYVICSGGLDSTTAAAFAKYVYGYDVTLLHYDYGCQAGYKEMESIMKIAEALDCKFAIENLVFLKRLGGNALVDSSIKIADSIEGAEYAHEWVPFRNGLMIALTAAMCDRFDVRYIFLGLNLEEGGAFPDNTEEFYQLFNKVLAIGSTSRPIIINPLGNLMKHEIVKLALEINAPIHLSWSCYRGNDKHCGICAPCYMRKKAFEMNGIKDMIEYENG